MAGVFFILVIVLFALLIMATSVSPIRSDISEFERKRKKQQGNLADIDELRDMLYTDVTSILRVLQALLLVLLVMAVVGLFGWIVGGLVAVVASLMYGSLARIMTVHRLSNSLYARYEVKVLKLFKDNQDIVRWMRTVVPSGGMTSIQSKPEFEHVVEELHHVLSDDEKKRIIHGLHFEERSVASVMTPKSVVTTIRHNEILGPLVLDDLHKSGHSRFPVIDEDFDHVVGILHVKAVLTLDTNRKHTAKAESAMSKNVYYIREDHTLAQALAAFIRTHHHLFIVINEYRETIGIITLEDTLEALIGTRIIDEFDAHDDMRAVAARQAAGPDAANRSKHSEDV